MQNFLIDLLAFAALFSSVLVITSKNPVIAVIFLISVFVNAAGYLIIKGIGFIGISYIIVYIGAIAVLFLFVIMMINIKLTDILEAGSQYTKNIPLAFAIGSLFLYELFIIMPFTINDVPSISYIISLFQNLNLFFLSKQTVAEVFTSFNPVNQDTQITNFLQIQAIGQYLYTTGGVQLVITSIILLLAMIAPIFISRKPVKK